MATKQLKFIKMSGTGNDFIVIDAQAGLNYKTLARQVCDRTNGIGADGLLVCDRSTKADYRMRIINADGSEAEMCGNGARCMAVYIVKFKKMKKARFTMQTLAGIITAEVKGTSATVQLSAPKDYQPDIEIQLNGRPLRVHFINTGVPHTVVFVSDLESIDVPTLGRVIRFHERFAPRGTNANFVEYQADDRIAIRTYERGVEDETKACGTGSVAAALIAYLQSNPATINTAAARMTVKTKGGELLQVRFDLSDRQPVNVWLKGPVRCIAQGTYFR